MTLVTLGHAPQTRQKGTLFIMTTLQSTDAELLYSAFGADPDLGEIVEMFVAEMPARCHVMRQAQSAKEWQDLERMAHQLKGAAGSYGFDQLTAHAAQLECALKSRADDAVIEQILDELIHRCRHIRAGIPHCSAH
jgi:HPt (histidine-containing phosphotransfer) domain-containing protein